MSSDIITIKMDYTILNNIKKVEVSKTVWNGIQHKIQLAEQDRLSNRNSILICSVALVCLLLNIFFISKNASNNINKASTENLVSSLQLDSNPDLYYE